MMIKENNAIRDMGQGLIVFISLVGIIAIIVGAILAINAYRENQISCAILLNISERDRAMLYEKIVGLSQLNTKLVEENDIMRLEMEFLVDKLDGEGMVVAGSAEKYSPYDFIKTKDIRLYSNRVTFNLHNHFIAEYSDTNSMDPVLDIGSNGIEIVPKEESNIHVGDIVSYNDDDNNILVHRVVKIGNDDDGWYALVQGDNAVHKDKIRFRHIKGVVVAIIY